MKFAKRVLIQSYIVELANNNVHLSQKVAEREVNSHSVVNCTTSIELLKNTKAKGSFVYGKCAIAIGGIATYPWIPKKTIAFLTGRTVSLAPKDIAAVTKVLRQEVSKEMNTWPDRFGAQYSIAYRGSLAETFVYKAIINALLKVAPKSVPAGLKSAGISHWGNWHVSGGTQSYQTDLYPAPLSQPYIKLMAMYQAQGEVRYTHEAPFVTGGLFGGLVTARVAPAHFSFAIPKKKGAADSEQLLAWVQGQLDGVVAVLTAADVPGENMQGMGSDQPLFVPAGSKVMYAGESLALVAATNQAIAFKAAKLIETQCISYKKRSAPILTVDEAMQKGEIFPDCPTSASFLAHIWKVTRPGSVLDWVDDEPKAGLAKKSVDGNECLVVTASQQCGGQLHFYMETQSCVAQPSEGDTLELQPSTQSPKSVQGAVCKVLNLDQNQIKLKVRQVGGAYGGKTEQSRFVPAMAALAAYKTNRPVKLVLDRETDSALIGKRHPYQGTYQIAFDTGTTNPQNKGLMRGVHGQFLGDGGAYYDCSFVVSDCMQLRVDSSYFVRNYQTQIDVCRTNTAPNTAYRAFGDIQATLVYENVIEDGAVNLSMDPADLREKNFYQIGQSTPAGQALTYCYQREVWDYTRKLSNYDTRRVKVNDFNSKNQWRKRGLCMIPLKYGSGFNLIMLEQTSALVNVYASDGTILIRQGGVDMGQGMVTKIAQIAAYELNVPLEIVRVELSDTTVVPSPGSTGASTGTQYNGEAVRQACQALRGRLHEFCQDMLRKNGEAWCKERNMDYWNFGTEGWRHQTTGGGTLWQSVVSQAYSNRVNLQAQVKAKMPGGTDIVPNVQFKPYDQQPKGTGIPIDKSASFSEPVNNYVGFTYNAACAEVEVDILTGEVKIIQVDIVYDMGKSLNPAIDIGQIEGAFMQGVGYVLTEEVLFDPNTSELLTPNTWTYKPPATTTTPLTMNVHLFPREEASEVPENPNTLYSSKEVGEPPLVLATSVFFAVKEAIRAARVEQKLPPIFEMRSPANVQAVSLAAKPVGNKAK